MERKSQRKRAVVGARKLERATSIGGDQEVELCVWAGVRRHHRVEADPSTRNPGVSGASNDFWKSSARRPTDAAILIAPHQPRGEARECQRNKEAKKCRAILGRHDRNEPRALSI